MKRNNSQEKAYILYLNQRLTSTAFQQALAAPKIIKMLDAKIDEKTFLHTLWADFMNKARSAKVSYIYIIKSKEAHLIQQMMKSKFRKYKYFKLAIKNLKH